MTSTDPHHEPAVGKARREWMKYPLAIGEPVIFTAIDDSGQCVSMVNRATPDSSSWNGATHPLAAGTDGAPSRRTRLVRLWAEGRGCIAMGLFCSALTCAASASTNALFDASAGGISSSTYLKRLAVGYSAAAVVVITVFPLLPALIRYMARLTSPKRGNRPRA